MRVKYNRNEERRERGEETMEKERERTERGTCTPQTTSSSPFHHCLYLLDTDHSSFLILAGQALEKRERGEKERREGRSEGRRRGE